MDGAHAAGAEIDGGDKLQSVHRDRDRKIAEDVRTSGLERVGLLERYDKVRRAEAPFGRTCGGGGGSAFVAARHAPGDPSANGGDFVGRETARSGEWTA